jgi:hypothetical protein
LLLHPDCEVLPLPCSLCSTRHAFAVFMYVLEGRYGLNDSSQVQSIPLSQKQTVQSIATDDAG